MNSRTSRRLVLASLSTVLLLALALSSIPVYQSYRASGRFPIFREPDVYRDFGLDLNLDRLSPGFVDPPVPEPGDTVTLTLGYTEQPALGGLWQPLKLNVQPIPQSLPDGSTFSWIPTQQDVLGVHAVWGNTINVDPYRARVLGADDSPLLQIMFDLPDNDSLRGQEILVEVELEVAYPVRLPADVQFGGFRNVKERIADTFAVKVGAVADTASYQDWEKSHRRWESKGWW